MCAQHASTMRFSWCYHCPAAEGHKAGGEECGEADSGICKQSGNRSGFTRLFVSKFGLRPQCKLHKFSHRRKRSDSSSTNFSEAFSLLFSLKVQYCTRWLQKRHICPLAQPKHHAVELMRVMLIFLGHFGTISGTVARPYCFSKSMTIRS